MTSPKLRLDLSGNIALPVDMRDHDELATRLLTLAGSIMEDASAVAIIAAGDRTLDDRASAVAGAAADARLLAEAAAVALRSR
jgi:hypothetical protein